MRVCQHCERTIVKDETGAWIDPEASGDDSVWRESCDAHDTFTAEHEPVTDDGERHRFVAMPYGVKPGGDGWTGMLIAQGIHAKALTFTRKLVVGCDVWRLDMGQWRYWGHP